MSRPVFLILGDRQAVQVDKIVSFEAVSDNDRTSDGALRRPIPEDSETRIDTVSGYFWTSVPFEDVVDQLLLASQQIGAGDA